MIAFTPFGYKIVLRRSNEHICLYYKIHGKPIIILGNQLIFIIIADVMVLFHHYLSSIHHNILNFNQKNVQDFAIVKLIWRYARKVRIFSILQSTIPLCIIQSHYTMHLSDCLYPIIHAIIKNLNVSTSITFEMIYLTHLHL